MDLNFLGERFGTVALVTPRCRECNRPLKSARSKKRGVGPKCEKKDPFFVILENDDSLAQV